MGVTISSMSELSPISLVSTIFGFIGFGFTILTFTNVFWASLLTIKNANSEIHDHLGGLKQGLYEERSHLREVRRRRQRRKRDWDKKHAFDEEKDGESTPEEEDFSTKIMRDTIRHMIAEFKALETPFLQDGRAYNEDTSWANERAADWYSTPYKECTLSQRWIWMRIKKDVVGMMDALSKIQIRRVAKEVGDLSFLIRDMDKDVIEIDDRVYNMEQRLTRVVGIRKVE